MSEPSYWIDVTSETSWAGSIRHLQELARIGKLDRSENGFSEGQYKAALAIEPGDVLLTYVSREQKFAALQRVNRPLAPYDGRPRWEGDEYGWRVGVTLDIRLPLEIAPSAKELLRIDGRALSGLVRQSPRALDGDRARVVVQALERLAHERGARPELPPAVRHELPSGCNETHESQYLIAELGSKFYYRVDSPDGNVASCEKHRIRDLRGFSRGLPQQLRSLDSFAQKYIELIDVLWIKDDRVKAAFEIEGHTGITSGLLRLSELLSSMLKKAYPLFFQLASTRWDANMVKDSLSAIADTIPYLYIVARQKHFARFSQEIQRPTFTMLGMAQYCSFIAFEDLWAATLNRTPDTTADDEIPVMAALAQRAIA